MAAILTVANIHFDQTGVTRVDHLNSDNLIRITANSVKLPVGTFTSRPTGEAGLIRYSSTNGNFEIYQSDGWQFITTNTVSNSVLTIANLAYNKANAANNLAYAALPNISGATFVGSLRIIDTLTVNAISSTNAFITANGSLSTNGNITSIGPIKTSDTVADKLGNVRIIPVSSTVTGTLTRDEVGKVVPITSGITISDSVFSIGDVFSVYNNTTGPLTITQASFVTMYLAGTATTGNRTLAQRGVATILCVGTNTFVITGSGLS